MYLSLSDRTHGRKLTDKNLLFMESENFFNVVN